MKKTQAKKMKQNPSQDWFIESEDSTFAYRLARNKNGSVNNKNLEYSKVPDWLIDTKFDTMSGEDFEALDDDLTLSGWKPVTEAVMPEGKTLAKLNCELNSNVIEKQK